jgi:hypothetical protein
MLYAGLADVGSFEQAGNPEPAVLRRLGIRPLPSRARPVEAILATAGIVAAVVAALIWLDLGPLAGSIAEVTRPLAAFLSPSLEIAKDYFVDLNHGVTTLVLGAVVLLSMVAVDMFLPGKRFVRSGRRHT